MKASFVPLTTHPDSPPRARAAFLHPPSPQGIALWQGVFANNHPVAIEIGPGRGEFLLSSAIAAPQFNYLGIERSSRRAQDLEAKLGGITNVRMLYGDAACILRHLPDRSVAAYHVQFPDPWWKRRHQRRRLFNSEFVATASRTLVAGGTIELVTDVEEYFHHAQRHFSAHPQLAALSIECDPPAATTFARKARLRGAAIYRSLHCQIHP